mmetsp:Transcript_9447/g.20786  ORF Transcript_9447/g.20786 Transcript_9447/m.20786 type:complete len:323 (-) Transcript_9447:376-1344(-)
MPLRSSPCLTRWFCGSDSGGTADEIALPGACTGVTGSAGDLGVLLATEPQPTAEQESVGRPSGESAWGGRWGAPNRARAAAHLATGVDQACPLRCRPWSDMRPLGGVVDPSRGVACDPPPNIGRGARKTGPGSCVGVLGVCDASRSSLTRACRPCACISQPGGCAMARACGAFGVICLVNDTSPRCCPTGNLSGRCLPAFFSSGGNVAAALSETQESCWSKSDTSGLLLPPAARSAACALVAWNPTLPRVASKLLDADVTSSGGETNCSEDTPSCCQVSWARLATTRAALAMADGFHEPKKTVRFLKLPEAEVISKLATALL